MAAIRKRPAADAGKRPEALSPGSEALWMRNGSRGWEAVYARRSLEIVRASSRSPMLTAFIDGKKVFGRVRFLPVAQQRCEAMVRLGLDT